MNESRGERAALKQRTWEWRTAWMYACAPVCVWGGQDRRASTYLVNYSRQRANGQNLGGRRKPWTKGRVAEQEKG